MASFTFDHIHIFCTDMEVTRRWFVDNFGAHDHGPTPLGMPKLSLGGTTFLLRAERPNEGLTPSADKRHFGTDHIGFAVDDIDAIHAELSAKGIRFEHPPIAPPAGNGLKITFLRGPDDVRIELLQFPR